MTSSGKYHPFRSRNWSLVSTSCGKQEFISSHSYGKNKPNQNSLSWSQFSWMQMLLFVTTDLRAFLGSSDHTANVRKFVGLFSFFWNSPFFHNSVSFLFFPWKNAVSSCWCFLLLAKRPLKSFLSFLWNAIQWMYPDDIEVNLKWVTNTYLWGMLVFLYNTFQQKTSMK